MFKDFLEGIAAIFIMATLMSLLIIPYEVIKLVNFLFELVGV